MIIALWILLYFLPCIIMLCTLTAAYFKQSVAKWAMINHSGDAIVISFIALCPFINLLVVVGVLLEHMLENAAWNKNKYD